MIYKSVILFLVLTSSVIAGESWHEIGEMPIPVYGAQAVTMDSIIYIFGGHGDSLRDPVNLIQSYDPRTGVWNIVGNMNVPRYGFVADKINDTLAIYCGGAQDESQESNSIETWNRFATSIQATKILNYNDNVNRRFLSGHYYDGYLFLFGGVKVRASNDTSQIPYIVRYDVRNNFTTFPNKEIYEDTEIPYHHMTVRVDSLVYILGGSRYGLLRYVRSFNLNSFEMKPVMPMPDSRAGGAVIYHKDSIWVIGGYSEQTDAIRSTIILDIKSLTSVSGPGLVYDRREMIAVNYYDEAIYIFGGRNNDLKIVPQIEKLDLIDAVDDLSPHIPEGFALKDNFPNPFNAATVLEFNLSEPGNTRLDIFSIDGRLIKSLFEGYKAAGNHRYTWYGDDEYGHAAASGIYIYRIVGKTGLLAKKMALIR